MHFKYINTWLFLSLTLIVSLTSGHSGSFVSDSLVQDLSCQNLKASKIYQHIRPEALTPAFHIPKKNWDFSVGLYDLAACWSLARTQRLFFYLARWGETPNMAPDKRTFELLEMIRGSSPYANYDDRQIKEFPFKEYPVFAQAESALQDTSELWLTLRKGFQQKFPNDKIIKRNFNSEIEFYQNRRFHDPFRNIRLIIGDGARVPKKNRATRDLLLRNLEENKLTLLLLRPKRVSQHVVLAKRFNILSNGNIEIWVYDSNSPGQDRHLIFSQADDNFYAPEIVGRLPSVKDPQAPVGVYIVDEGEREIIERALIKYYKKKCS